MNKTLSCCLAIFTSVSFAQVATTNIIDINTTVMNNTPLLFGISFDARTSMTGSTNYGQIGYYNADATIIPAIGSIFNDFPMSTLRYPANAVSFGFDWKKSIGPTVSRPNQSQNLMGALGGSQPINFGFDEFMAMTASKGVSPSDIQIMIPIYDNTTVGLTPTQALGAISNPASFNADWVEYCNTPNDGSNPGGGIDWAAQRAANGHPAPYGIKIWNIGNEPWASGEFGSTSIGCNNYLAYVTPIINAMLAIDPTLHITLPTTGTATNSTSWAYTILNSSLVAQHKIFGLSQHYFLNENINPQSGTILTGVTAAQTNLTSLINVAAAKGVKVLIGDYAHSIPSNTTRNDINENIAMQWQGANLEADFLLMVSQMNNIDRMNFWVYGIPYNVWHPIRINSIGSYTLMPAAAIYKKLFPAFLNKSVAVSFTSPAASDGNNYAIRSGAFISTDRSLLNFVSVNRDKLMTVLYHPDSVAGYMPINARLLTANSLQSENFYESIVSADGVGNYSMPALSILILEYAKMTDVGERYNNIPNKYLLSQNYPNPFNPRTSISFSVPQSEFVTLKVYDVIGKEIVTLVNENKPAGKYDVNFDTSILSSGIYFYKLQTGNFTTTKKMVLMK